MRKINLMFINYSFDVGGIETLILEMCKSLDKNRFNISVCCFQEENYLAKEFKQQGIPMYCLKKKPGIDISLFVRMRRLYKEQRIDVVHTHNAAQWLYGAVAAVGMSKPAVIHTQHMVMKKEKGMLMHSLRFLAMKSFRVVCVAEYLIDYLVKHAKIQRNKLCVVSNGIDISKLRVEVDKKKKLESLGINENSCIIGVIARLVPNKNHRNLLDAFKIAGKTINNAHLIIVGDGDLREELAGYTDSLDMRSKVHFLGNRRDIAELLNIFDIFALPSDFEGLPVSLLEAMAARVPVIATDVGGNAEVVLDNNTGIIVPPRNSEKLAEAIIMLLNDKNKRDSFRNNAEKLIKEKFSFSKMIRDYSEIYEKAAGM